MSSFNSTCQVGLGSALCPSVVLCTVCEVVLGRAEEVLGTLVCTYYSVQHSMRLAQDFDCNCIISLVQCSSWIRLSAFSGNLGAEKLICLNKNHDLTSRYCGALKIDPFPSGEIEYA